jgi:hypothetical protein
MPRGTCKLCHKDAELQLSHLIGRAVYKLCRKDQGDDSIVMTTKVVMKTSRQIRDYVVCAKCEDRFNKGGERYATSLVSRLRKGFPLLDKLRLALPMQGGPNYHVFSGERVGVDTDKLAYYALSVVWRSGIHHWKSVENQTTSVVLATTEEEAIRKYLLGETALPGNIGVMVNVCTDLASQALVLTPTSRAFPPSGLIYKLLVRGIDFWVLLSSSPNIQFVEMCCVRSPAKKIFLRDCSQLTLNAVKHFYEGSKWARNARLGGAGRKPGNSRKVGER